MIIILPFRIHEVVLQRRIFVGLAQRRLTDRARTGRMLHAGVSKRG